jgi:hypothetical protein
MRLTRHKCAGSEVWCDGELYPRLLTEMIHGKAEHRCACFKERGWSDLRRLYPDCAPTLHRCNLTQPAAPADEL